MLDKPGQSCLAEQQALLRRVFTLLGSYHLIVLGDREFHSVSLGHWLMEQEVSFVLRLYKSTTVKTHPDAGFERLNALLQFPEMTSFEVQVQVTPQRGMGRFNLVIRWKRVCRYNRANEVWYLPTNLDEVETALECYRCRFFIEPMFKDLKTGGYCMEQCQAIGQRFLTIVLLIAIAYTTATEQGNRIRRKQVSEYVGRVKEPRRSEKRHSDFWLGLYGRLWIDAMEAWSTWAEQLMQLKPQKRAFYLRGLRAMSLIQSAF